MVCMVVQRRRVDNHAHHGRTMDADEMNHWGMGMGEADGVLTGSSVFWT